MKKIILYILGGLVVLVLGLVGYAATKPDTFHVQRSATIPAPAEKIFPHINSFHAWAGWSPYEKLDPAMKRTFGGAASGKGATYAWEGNSDAGAGSMEITESTPPGKIVIALRFTKPFEAQNTAQFMLQPQGEATNVTWAVYGPMPLISKVMTLFFSMDNMLGKQFEEGLMNLKTLATK